jgi:hypothetical protein
MRARGVWVISAVIAVIAVSAAAGGVAHAAPEASCPPAVVAGPDGKKPPQPVIVGLYLNQVAAIDIKSNTFLADFYLWFRWRGDIDPTQSFELVNAVETWDFQKEAIYKDDDGEPKPDDLPDGCKFQQLKLQGRFAHPFQLAAYPLDRQELTIRLEDSKYTSDELVYLPDLKDSRISPTMEIPGWQIHGGRFEVHQHAYATPMGDPRLEGLPCSQFRATLALGRPLVGYLSKTLVPIAFVVLITLLIFFVSLRYYEGRLGLAVTTLISAVALQLTTSADLPQVGYLVLIDKLYNLSYVLILFAMLESTVAARWHDAGREEAARRLDRGAALVSIVAVVVTTLLVFR